jgi:hypothetical protein
MKKIDKDFEALEDQTELVFSIIEKLRRLPHTFFAKEGNTQKDFSKHFHCFNVLNVFEFVVQIILEIHSATDPSVASKLDCIYKSLNDCNLSMAIFLESYTMGRNLMNLLDKCHEILKQDCTLKPPKAGVFAWSP